MEEVSHRLTSRECARGDSSPQVDWRGDSAAETGIRRPGSNHASATDSLSPSRSLPAPSPGERLHRLALRACAILQRRVSGCDRRGTRCPPQPTVARQLGSARSGPGCDPSRRQPRPAPGMRSLARARARPEKRPRPRVERTLPPQRAPHPQRPAHQSYASADGHRFPALTATSAAASPPLLRLRPAATASASAHLPAVGQRRHQPTSAGTRQWRPGRSVEVVGAEGAHAAAATAVT